MGVLSCVSVIAESRIINKIYLIGWLHKVLWNKYFLIKQSLPVKLDDGRMSMKNEIKFFVPNLQHFQLSKMAGKPESFSEKISLI